MPRLRVPLLVSMFVALALGACATPPPPVTATPSTTPEAMVAAIRAAADHAGAELAIQPLRDPMVEDLREQAQRLEQQRRYPEAVAALDHALQLVPDDPALLQERAEAALLSHDFTRAAQLARRGWELGAKVGPLCRRHWETLRQLRLAAGDAAGAGSAQVQREACTVAGPARY
jgi:tetratricopeptide (TPR) repeat protein